MGIERKRGDQRALRAGTPTEVGRREGKEREPGEAYAIYRSRDALGELPEGIESVISFGARFIGVDEERLLKVSEGYERRLFNWSLRQRGGEGIEGRRGPS
jgi:RNA polymerase I-specific transcription initiation factor RRN7